MARAIWIRSPRKIKMTRHLPLIGVERTKKFLKYKKAVKDYHCTYLSFFLMASQRSFEDI
jgi:hypothetical protein